MVQATLCYMENYQLPSPKRGQSSQFSAHFYCCQTAGCVKMPLGMEVCLSPFDFVLDGDPASPPLKGHSPPIFVQCPLRPNDWMDEDATWYGSRPRPRPHCISSARKGHSSPHLFGPCLLCPPGRPSQLLLSSCLVFSTPSVFLVRYDKFSSIRGRCHAYHTCPAVLAAFGCT